MWSSNYWISQFLRSFSIVAVNCFVLITGYFMSASKVNYKRLIPLWIQVEVYSVGVYLFLCFIPIFDVTFNIKTLIRMAFPVLTNQYWFFTLYFVLIILAPFLNRFIASMDNKEYRRTLTVLLVVFSAIPTINIFGDNFGTDNGYSLIWFCVLYLVAGYIRKFGAPKMHYEILYIGFSLLNVTIAAVCGKMLNGVMGVSWLDGLLCDPYNSALVFAASVCLFLAAVQARTNYGKLSKQITKIASLSFGVYLLHENPQFRNILWNKIVCLSNVADNAALYALKFVGAVVTIFIVGVFIDWIRKMLTPQVFRR